MNRRVKLLISMLLALCAGGVAVALGAQPGSVDPTFDPGRGARDIRAGEAHGLLIQPDGRIIVGACV